jgi:hypothetical protein
MTQGFPGANSPPIESAVGASAGSQIRQIVTYEYQPLTNSYVQVSTEVVAVADPLTGMTVRVATAEQMQDAIDLLRALLRCQVETLNRLSEPEGTFAVDDFLSTEEEGSG